MPSSGVRKKGCSTCWAAGVRGGGESVSTARLGGVKKSEY